MAIKYIDIFPSKALQNLPKLVFFGLKTNHLATLHTTTTSRRREKKSFGANSFAAGLPDLSWYNIPKRGIYTRCLENLTNIYQIFTKYP
jgi:hypothetical protein